MSGRMSSHLLRKGRYCCAGQIYLVTATAQNRAPLFTDWRLGRLVVRQLRLAHDRGEVRSLAWVVMPDHMHWLFELRRESL
ncbi:MAG: hypothetical protein K0R45_3401, partial [Pseudomonas sp.]|nr:hypothetical protein [Pseudomonas sp.]